MKTILYLLLTLLAFSCQKPVNTIAVSDAKTTWEFTSEQNKPAAIVLGK